MASADRLDLPFMRARAAVVAALLAAGSVESANPHRMEQRAEALRLVDSILTGASLEGDLARVKYLGEEDIVCVELMKALELGPERRIRENVAFAFSILSSRVTEGTLLHMLGDEDPVIRMHAVQGLGHLRTRAWRAIAPLLRDKSMGVRAESARALGAIKAAQAGKALLAAARAEEEPEVRSAMLAAAGDSGDKSAVRGLATFLSSTSETTRLGAARGLCHLGAPEGFAFAKKLLESKDKFERRNGVDLFEGAAARVAGPFLKPLLEDGDIRLAAKAARILYQGGDAIMLDWLVLASFHSKPDEKDAYERELELLHLQDDQRKSILAKAGIQ
jgi:HEAT repeat protein